MSYDVKPGTVVYKEKNRLTRAPDDRWQRIYELRVGIVVENLGGTSRGAALKVRWNTGKTTKVRQYSVNHLENLESQVSSLQALASRVRASAVELKRHLLEKGILSGSDL